MARKIIILAVLVAAAAAIWLYTQNPTPDLPLDSAYSHDRFNTLPKDVMREFAAFTVSFDSADDDDGDGRGDARGVAEWVAYEIKRYHGFCVPTGERPKWFSDEELVKKALAPKDDSYSSSGAARGKNAFDRGHLAPKFLAARIGPDAERNTHTLLNAVPQRHEFNAGIWLDLERLTGAWAQKYGRVWVVAGPIFDGKKPSSYLGEKPKGEFQVAIPDALYKIVVKESGSGQKPEALAFVYRQEGAGYARGPFDHQAHLVTIDEVERATGLDFLSAVEDAAEEALESSQAASLWPVSESDFVKECRQ